MSLHAVPAQLKRHAIPFVAAVHRHQPQVTGGLFAVAVADENGQVRGVAIVGRPTAAALQDGATAEVLRVAVLEGTPNACSLLYGAAWRAARALGYWRCITYTRPGEPGTSLQAAGWVPTPAADGGADWTNRPGRCGERVGGTRWTASLAAPHAAGSWPADLEPDRLFA